MKHGFSPAPPGRAAKRLLLSVVAAMAMAGAVQPPPRLSAQEVEPDRFAAPVAGTWEPVRSMGQPPRGKPFVGFGFGTDGFGEHMQWASRGRSESAATCSTRSTVC